MSESTDHLRDTFRAKGRRLTSQRRLILGVLQESGAHLDAESLFLQAKKREPDICLATVYRTLAVLKEMGLVEEHRLGEEHSHYEAVRGEPHYHFTCVACGEVVEFDAPLVARIEQELCEQEGVLVTDTHLHVSGYCTLCQNRVEGDDNNET
jgi:Fe2+ or Zn2+ uptake regulation protein